ncbi:MAG: TonB-dependent receptor, partial [Ignavibacteria bacterium]|nr:TonB-dependent receptor [Ignavibacteria bacterium]
NELLVRGGSPNENLTVYDNMELHSTNHYPNEMNSGGPINMVNVDLIENIQFSTGGFISKYGDKLSSVMSIETREGTRNSLLKGNANLSMAGAGVILEGGINNGKGSWVFSARKSYIDLIAGSFGLTAIPKYYDFQFKAGYDLSPMHHLSISGIYGNDKILFDGEPEVTHEWLANSKDSVGYNRIDVKQSQIAIGTSLKSIWNKNFYSLVTVYHNNLKYFIDVDENFVQRSFDAAGKSFDYQLINSRKIVRDDHHTGIIAGKSEFVWKLSNENELSFGGFLGSGDFVQDVYVFGDSARYWLSEFNAWSATVVKPFSQMTTDIKYFDQQKYYFFVNDKIKLFDNRVMINVGLRYDYFSYSEKGYASPRISASYYIIPGITNFNLAYGE